MTQKKWRIGIVVGEVSGDTLGAKLIQSFQKLGIDAEFEGIGGQQMQALGFHSLYPMEVLSVMGIVEVLKDIRQLFAVRDGLVERWQQQPIDVFIGIDAPDFNLRLSKKIKALNLPIKTVQYVSPSVWAWRQKRIFSIKQSVDLVLCLFPFEVEFYQRYAVPAVFVGHPLAQQLPLQDNASSARRQLNLDESATYIALLPGSRRGEVQRLLPILLQMAQGVLTHHAHYHFLIPAINQARYQQILAEVQQLPQAVQSHLHLIENRATESNIGRLVMEASNAVVLASGTATLEAMLLHRPMVMVYNLHWLTYWIVKRLIKIPYYSLPNIIAGNAYVPELVQHDATAERIQYTLEQLMHSEQAEQQRAEHLRLHQQLQSANTLDPTEAIVYYLFK